MKHHNSTLSNPRLTGGLSLRTLPAILVGIFLASSSVSFAQTKVDIEVFKDRSQEKRENLEGMGEEIISITWTDPNGAILEQWRSLNGKAYPRQKGSAYVFVVPGPEGQFLRKAWLTMDGEVIEEERRVYDSKNRLTVEGYVDPVTGSFTLEFRHRYSADGKTQFTTEFQNGKQVGEETSQMLEE